MYESDQWNSEKKDYLHNYPRWLKQSHSRFFFFSFRMKCDVIIIIWISNPASVYELARIANGKRKGGSGTLKTPSASKNVLPLWLSWNRLDKALEGSSWRVTGLFMNAVIVTISGALHALALCSMVGSSWSTLYTTLPPLIVYCLIMLLGYGC